MKDSYDDIRERVDEEPSWYDENGCPRYGAFGPDMVPNIYADEVVLLEIGCQACDLVFQVGVSLASHERFDPLDPDNLRPTLQERIEMGQIRYGDPPNHVDTCAMGASMNSIPRRVLGFWRRNRTEWGWDRVRALEIELPTDWVSVPVKKLPVWPPVEGMTVPAIPIPPRLLPLMAACEQLDRALVRAEVRALVAADPEWYLDRILVRALVQDIRFAFFLAHPADVFETLGGTPENLAALHRRHQIQSLLAVLNGNDPDSRS